MYKFRCSLPPSDTRIRWLVSRVQGGERIATEDSSTTHETSPICGEQHRGMWEDALEEPAESLR